MTDQLVKWLNKDVGLSRTVKAFEVDFANGYLFGELLNKHGLLTDSEFADSFMDASTLSAKRNNLSKLKALLNSSEASNLGIRLKDEQITHIMDEDRGTALRMLYQMRKKFLELPDDRVPQRQKDFLARLQREPKGHHEERHFDSSIKSLPRTAPRVVYELHNKGFVDEHTRHMQKASEDEAVKALATTQRQAEFNQSRQERMRTHKECVAEMEMSNEESWQVNMRRRAKLVEHDLNFEKKTIAREQAKIDRIRAAHQLDCGLEEGIQSHGIGWFEKNLQRIGIDTSEHAGKQPVPRSDGCGHEGIEATNAKELYDQMRGMLPHAGQQKVECTAHMKRCKDTKKANDTAQRERDRRMRRQTVDNQVNQKTMESNRAEEDLLRWLQTETAGSQKEAAAYDLDQRYKVAVLNVRASQQNVCGQSMEIKTEEAWGKFAQKAREERAEKLEEREVKRQKEVMRGGLGLDALAAEGDVDVSSDEGVDWENDPFGPLCPTSPHKLEKTGPAWPALPITAKTGSALPDESEQERRRSRSQSMNLLEQSQDAAPLGSAANVMPAKALIEFAQDPRTSEYLFWRGEWGTHRPEAANVRAWLEELQSGSSQQVMSPVHQPQFGGLVRWFFAPEAPKVGGQGREAELAVDYLPIVALTGNPIKYGNLGASLKAAQKVCSEFGFELVEPRKVVDECITLAQKEELGSDWPPIVRMAELGKIFLEESSKSADATVPQSLFAEMVFRKIELLSAPPPPPVLSEEELAAQAKAKAKAKSKEEVEEVVRPNGVLLHGYLAELGQHASWELALRGHASSLLRINNGERDLQAQLSSMITSWTFAEVEARSYLDLPKVASAPPVQLLRLRHPSHAELCRDVISEAGNEKAWINGDFVPSGDAPQEDPKGKGKGKKPPAGKDAVEETVTNEIPAVLCRGYEYESTHVDNPVDRAWLYEETQLLVDAFAGPLRNYQDVAPIIEAQGEEAESSEDALCRQVLEIVTALRQPAADDIADDADAEAAVEAPAEAPAEGEEAEPPAEAPVPEDRGDCPSEMDAANAATGPSVPWLALPEEQGWMRDRWLECMSLYISRLHATIKEVHEESKTYNKGLVQMQRDFLTFLQGTDEKTNLMDDFLQTWPARFSRRQPDDINEEVEDLSDRLWSFADCRRAVSVEEHVRLFRSGFWEEKAIACLRLAAELFSIECHRYTVAAELLASGYSLRVAGSSVAAATDLVDVSPEGLSSIAELSSWISGLTTSIAAAPLPLPSSLTAVAEADENKEIQETSEKPEVVALCAALGAEKVDLVQRLRTIEAWTMARLQEMREQHDEAFARMDDWIRDRVRVENDAIKAAIAQVLDCSWNDEADPAAEGTSRSLRSQNSTLPRQGSSSMRSPAKSPKTSPSPTGGLHRRKRREVLKSLYPGTLDVEVLQPPSLEVVLARSIKPANDSLTSCWTQDMLLGLVQTICERSPGIAAIGVDALLAAVLERRSSGFKFDIDVVPPAWVLRSEAALATFCSAWVTPAWGNVAVDITDLLLHLTFHERKISWPSAEALMASREMLESTASGLSEEELTAYPDVPVSEELFMKLPLWDDNMQAQLREQPLAERLMGIKLWIFRILLCFQDEAMPVLPSSEGRPETATISARRIFTYLGLGATPMAGLQQSLKLMISPIPPKEVAEGEESPPKILVQDLWAILFSCRSRPTAAALPPPELADFCTDLLAPEVDPDLEPPMSAGKPVKPGKPGKGAVPDPEPVEEEKAPPPLPEEMTVVFDDKLVRNKAVLRGLCTHGGLLCRRRALAVLFSAASQLHDTAEAADARGLTTLVPYAEPPQEDAPDAEA